MRNFKIYLIEDYQKNADLAISVLNEAASSYADNGLQYCFDFFKGTAEGNDGYVFYEPEIIQQIKDKIAEERSEGNLVGLLLDTLLTKEDVDNAATSYYARASISKEIYFQFYKEIPIYIVTATAAFGSQSDIIMGADLSDRYISNRSLVKRDKKEIQDLFSFYQKFYEKEGSPVKLPAECGV